MNNLRKLTGDSYQVRGGLFNLIGGERSMLAALHNIVHSFRNLFDTGRLLNRRA